MKTYEDRYYKTSSFNLAVFLYTNDQQISGVNPTNDGGRRDFVFTRTNYLDELIDLYKFGNKKDDRLLVNIHKLEWARQELLSLLKD
jgi:hypothetical protein